MNMNPLPPQAYTKETLAKAFAWLQGQPENIKEIARNSDMLVSLYLKTKMNGEDALERPSIKNFKSELKSLASQMGEFEILQNSSHSTIQYQPPQQTSMGIPLSPPLHQPTSNVPNQRVQAPSTLATHPETVQSALSSQFDHRTNEILREITKEFNLSNEQEALRLLVAVGYKAFKKI